MNKQQKLGCLSPGQEKETNTNMKKQPKKLTLNKETLRDLTTPNAGEVKGGPGATLFCGVTNAKHCTKTWLRGDCH